MSEPFLAEIRIVGFNFAPRGWAFCDGQILPINQNQSLYSLLGTYYRGGAETVTLTAAEMAAHSHTAKASSQAGNDTTPADDNLATTPAGELLYRDPEAATMTSLSPGTITNAGGGQAHDNMQPYLTLAFCIALQGLFPSRN